MGTRLSASTQSSNPHFEDDQNSLSIALQILSSLIHTWRCSSELRTTDAICALLDSFQNCESSDNIPHIEHNNALPRATCASYQSLACVPGGLSVLDNMARSLKEIITHAYTTSYGTVLYRPPAHVSKTLYIVHLLRCAVEHGIQKPIHALVAAGVDLWARDDDNRTALILAAGAGLSYSYLSTFPEVTFPVCDGNTEVVRLLLAAKGDVDSMDYEGMTALSWACIRNHAGVVRELIAARANLNIRSERGVTALAAAACRGHVEGLRLLLAAGADTSVTDEYMRSALVCAAENGHMEACRILLSSDATGSAGGLLLHAAEGGNASIVRLCLEDPRAAVHARASGGCTAAILAAKGGHVDALRLLVAAGADVHAKDDSGKSALLWAALRGRRETVQTLLELRADVNARDIVGEGALMWALMDAESVAVVEDLVAAGADVETANVDGFTPLMCAVLRNNAAGVSVLLRAQASVEPRRDDKAVLLTACGSRTDAAIIELLVAAGACLDSVTSDGETALMLLARRGQADTMVVLLDAVRRRYACE